LKIIILIIAAACFIGMAYHAWPAGRTDQEIPLSATESRKDAVSAKAQCTRQRVLILAQRLPNGKAIPVMVAVVTVPC
jgi:Flp pilus assembly protein CpaB